MDMGSEESASEILQAKADLIHTFSSFYDLAILKSAVELDIPDIIHNHGRPIPLSSLVAALPINPKKSHCIPRLMRVLVHTGLFVQENTIPDTDEQVQEAVYSLTPAARLLLKDHPLNQGSVLWHMLIPELSKPWYALGGWLKNDDPTAFMTANGRTFWDYVGQESSENNKFNDQMAKDSKLLIGVVIEKYKEVFEGIGFLVDVGGGTGSAAEGISNAFPDIKCIVFDRPNVVASLQDREKISFVGGNMSEAIPQADAILLKWILHNWSDEGCLQVLRKCRDAISNKEKRGKLIIIEIVMKKDVDEKDVGGQLLFDMMMMVGFNSKERNEEEFAKLFSDAGFGHYNIHPLTALVSLIEVYP